MSDEAPGRYRLAHSRAARLRRSVAAALEELPGLVGLVLVASGVYRLWGGGWAMLAVGAIFLAAYAWSEWRQAKGFRRGAE